MKTAMHDGNGIYILHFMDAVINLIVFMNVN